MIHSASTQAEQSEERHHEGAGASRNVLLVEHHDALGAERPLKQAHELPALDLPREASVLVRDSESGELRLEPHLPEERAPAGPVFEPLSDGVRAGVAMLSSPGGGLRVNGLQASLVEVLRIGDQVRLDSLTLLHLTAYESLAIAPAADALIGRLCGVCNVPFSETTLVYVCEQCGHARHAEGIETPIERRLECVKLGHCDNCDRPVPTEPGFVHLPEV